MILVVEKDRAMIERISTLLKRDGYNHLCVGSSEEAIARSETEPDLILVDVESHLQNGLSFLQEYGRLFPHRSTPFILLSDLADPHARVHALDAGADAFIAKPVDLEVLRAEIRAVIQRKNRYTAPTFYGDLSSISFPRLLRFCATKSISGEIVISSEERHARLLLRGGELVAPDSTDLVDFVAGLYELKRGTCVIRVNALEFREIEKATLPLSKPDQNREKPVGRLSAVRADTRQFQIQTELGSVPRERILTIVTLAGKIILKRESLPPDGAPRKQLDALIETQHRAVEDEVRDRLNPDVLKRIKKQESRNERLRQLYDLGCERYAERDYASALRNWEEAQRISPGDASLALGVRVVRKKLGLPAADGD